MASRLKEDERNERTIRNLLKLPENRRCINCNSLGPQYVCTNFSTFVCTTCSGIHREFTHRVKSVSMAKFSSLEVSALQGGGNASAKEIYFKEWDPQRNSFPDSSNVEKLRDFIKHVYVDRRYSGERSFDKPPRGRMGEAEDSNETRRIDPYQGGSRSPSYDDTYEHRYGERPSPGGRSDDRSSKNSYDERRSPGYDQDNRQYGDYRKSPAQAEVITDWRREDRFGDGRRSEDNKISDGGSKFEGRSPDRQRNLDISSPPVVRPVREILGESVTPLRIIEPPKVNGAKTQRTASSSSLASTNENPTELRTESSLIDFDAIPEPSSTAPVPQTQQTSPGPSLAQPIASSNDNWANFGPAPEVKVSQVPSSANLLDVLSELSVPASLPTHTSLHGGNTSLTVPPGSNLPSSHNPPITSMGNTQMSPFGTSASVSAPVSYPMTYLPGTAVGPAHVPAYSFVSAADAGQWQGVHSHQQFVPATGSQPPSQSFTQAVGANISNQPWIGNTPNTTVAQSPVTSGVATSVDVRPTIKKELPEDLFASKYSPFPAAGPGWYVTPQYGVQLNMQYNMAAAAQPMPTFPQPSKSSNPFDVHTEPAPVQPTTFPSMTTLHGALPNMAAPTGILRTSSLPPAWTPPQSSYPLAMPPQGLSYGSSVLPGPYMGQAPPNMPPRPQGVGGFGSLNPSQQQSGLYSAPTNTNGFPAVGGNPFG